MAQAVALVLTGIGATTAAATLVTAAGTLTLAGVVVNIGGALLLSELTRPDIPDAATPDNIQSLNQAAAGARVRHYGLVKAGGNVVLHRARDGRSYRVIVHGHDEISRIVGRFLNNETVSVDDNGFITDDQYQHGGRSRVQLFERLGKVPETHYSEITDVWPEWTSSHRLDGLWTSLIVSESVPPEQYRAMYPKNEPDLAILAETTACLDTRTGQKVFTENMALAIRDYVASVDGFNRPDAFEDQDISDQADICDREVALAAGGTEKLYRISGSYLLNEKPQNVLGRMLSACAGRIRLKPSGKVGLKVGAWSEPEFTLSFADILEVQDVNSGPDLLDRYNELPARFNSHDLGHVEVDAEPWRDADRVEEDGAVLTGPDKSLMMCPSHRQARQVMKIHMERDNPKQEVTLLCKPRALPAIYEDTVALHVPQLALTGDYEVARHALSFEKGLLRAVGLTLRKVNSEAFTLSLAEQGEVQTLPPADEPSGVPVPENVTAAGVGVKTTANTFVAGIGVGWSAPASDALSPVVKYSPEGLESWQDVAVGSGKTNVHISPLADGGVFDVSVAFATPGGVIGDAVIISSVTARAVADPPAAPTGLNVTDAGGGTAQVQLTAATSVGLWKTIVFRNGVQIAEFPADVSAISFVDACGAGSFNWTARSVNVSDIPSDSDAGPFSATIA